MKSSISSLFKTLLLIFLIFILGDFVMKKYWVKETSDQETIVNQTNTNQSKIDHMNTIKANTLILQKDSIINSLNSRIASERIRTKVKMSIAKRLHLFNDSLYALYEEKPDIVHCEELICSLGVEINKKDTLNNCLIAETESYIKEVKTLEEKVILQKGIIESKENLILYKDSTITYYNKQKKESDFWSDIKLKAAIGMILFETIALVLR